MTQAKLPGARAALVDQNGLAAPAFYRFLAALETAQSDNVSPAEIDAIQAEIAAIQAEIDALPEGQGYPDLQVSAPLLSHGLLKNGFAKLALNQPGDSGTGALKGVTLDAWGRVTGTTDATITGTAGRVTVANGDAAAGVPTIDLAAVIDTGGGSLLKFVRDAWGRITGTSTPTTTDLTEGANLYYTDLRADARITAQKGHPSGLATLDSGGKLDAGQLPSLAITDTFVVSSQAAMLALSAQQGDVAVRTDLHDSFILTTNSPSVLADWQELETPVDGVASFNGRTGSVTPASGDYTFAQIGSKPTTLGGYGITDALEAVNNLSDVANVATARGNLGVVIPKGYIDGLQMVWNSATSISVTSGTAYIPSLGNVLASNSTLTLSGLSLTASTWYHVYLYSNAGTPAIECVTTAPVLYNGTAASKTGDNTRRYVGSLLTDSSSNIVQFYVDSAGPSVKFLWVVPNNTAPWRLIAGGSATTPTNINASAVIPAIVAQAVIVSVIFILLPGNDMQVALGPALIAGNTNSGQFCAELNNPGASTYNPRFPSSEIILNGNVLQYMLANFGTAGGTVNIDARGFVINR